MGSLQGPVICPTVRAKQVGFYTLPMIGPFRKARLFRSEFLGFKGISCSKAKVGSLSHHLHVQKCQRVHCSYDSSSNGNGSSAENFDENDEEYVNSSVIEAVEMPSVLLMAAVRNVPIARPTLYQVVKEMVDKMGYEVRLVRVTKRVHEAYFAQLYLTKVGNGTECVSFDLRPSDAINIAVRCKVPIQVNKYLAYSDGMRVIESGKLLMQTDGLLFTEMDRPSGQPCIETKEFNLVRNMLIAAVEERYRDAAQWRDKLSQLRARRNLNNSSWTV
ncbi:bifunctional nuclease 2-like isoform X2 [Juglans microcarpa x Juglans regia]|uniref:bifunctional nuclease 2-like isoform X2 n=1 Tax=Juglans microcarpa x Juglans regia TaxID=2249226 RepID=UPI001B7EE7F0|nr:bifunctional nuclease 2-like isoform X2 [Juglans microcarpa x Juglans regia]